MLEDAETAVEEEDDNWLDTTWAEPHISSHSTDKRKFDKEDGVKNDVLKTIDRELERESQTQNSSFGRIQLNDNKAGMSGCDKERINQIIFEASKGSKYFENEQRKENLLQARIENQREKLHKLSDGQIAHGLMEADKLLIQLESERILTRTIVHIDMDAFYAAVEERDNPSLKSKPMAVGGNDMLSTSNYTARKYGVRAAMPGFIAKKLCSDLIIVPTNFDKYKAVSKEFQKIFSLYDPNYCMMSLDEAYLDFTEYLIKRKTLNEKERTFIIRNRSDISESCKCDLNERLRDKVLDYCSDKKLPFDKNELLTAEKILRSLDTFVDSTPPLNEKHIENLCPVCDKKFPSFYVRTFGIDVDEAVIELRSRVEQKTQLTASAGIAANTMLAKICSDKNKPNGQFRLESTVRDVLEFVRDLPLRKVSGIGKISEKMLNAIAVKNCHDLFEKRAVIYHLYSSISFNYFMRVSQGIGSCTIERDHARKSMSTERTFRELSVPEKMQKMCMELCEALSTDLSEEQLKGKTVTLKLKTVNFEVKTKARTLAEYTSDTDMIYKTASELLKAEIQAKLPDVLKIRLMGVRMSNLLHKSLLQTWKKQVNISGFFKKPENDSNACISTEKNEQLNQCDTDIEFVHDEKTYQTSDDCKSSTNMIVLSAENGVEDQINIEKKGVNKSVGMSSPKKLLPVDSNSNSATPTETFICPVCDKEILTCNLQLFNQHVDICLNKRKPTDIINNTSDKSFEELSVEELPSGGDNPSHSSSSAENLICPICDIKMLTADLQTFNEHVDVCLNKGTIKQLITDINREKHPLKRKSDSKLSSTSVKRKKVNKTELNGKRGSILDFIKREKEKP